LVDLGSVFGRVLQFQLEPGTLVMLLSVALAIAIVLGLAWLLFSWRRGRASPPGDVYGIVFFPSTHTVSVVPFARLDEGIYTATSFSHPLFLVVPPGVKSYNCRIGRGNAPCYLAMAYNLFALPLNPKAVANISYLLETEDMAEISKEDTMKILGHLVDLEEEKVGVVRISPMLNFAMAFNVNKLVSELVERDYANASEVVTHLFRAIRNTEVMSRYLSQLTAFVARRWSWLVYLAILILAAGIAAGLFMMFVR